MQALPRTINSVETSLAVVYQKVHPGLHSHWTQKGTYKGTLEEFTATGSGGSLLDSYWPQQCQISAVITELVLPP